MPPPPPQSPAARKRVNGAAAAAAVTPKRRPQKLPRPSSGIHIVQDRETARRVVETLMAHPEPFYAVDTEVAEIDVKTVGPVDNGYVTCISIYGGPDLDLGEGPGKILWVDNLDEAEGVLDEFRPFLESEQHKKVWHNYAFDRHVLFNRPRYAGGSGINCRGFGGDTMHMARLWDTSMEKKAGETGFSLEALSVKLLGGEENRKIPMKDLFGVPKKRKDGSDGSLKELPCIDELQRSERTREGFIKYAARDASATWEVREVLEQKLRELEWTTATGEKLTMWEFYQAYYVPFGELLTDMEREGIYVNAKGHLAQVEQKARQDQQQALQQFLDWVKAVRPEAEGINPGSSTQIQTLLFGGARLPRKSRNGPEPEPFPEERVFRIEKTPEELAAIAESKDLFSDMTIAELKAACAEAGLRKSGTKAALQKRLRGLEPPDPAAEFKAMKVKDLRDACEGRGLGSKGTKAELVQRLVDDTAYALAVAGGGETAVTAVTADGGGGEEDAAAAKAQQSRHRDLVVRGLGIQPVKYTKTGQPAVSMDVLRALAGDPREDPPRYGLAYEHLGGGEAGRAASVAIDALCNMGSIDTMLSNFLLPLQSLVDARSRVHCSLNLNTETGRLSARRPNLQNQPALEKDQYKIRYAFQAEEGKRLVVADYGQLELRLLAHISNCKSMLDAFASGGCFHSRTAVGMFDHVKEAVENGDVYLEWDYSKGKPDKPLVKDVYGAERRKAKTLNFSIAYGKTAHGLSKDWGVTVPEAQELLKAWYADRPEVKKWQEDTIKEAHKTGYARTLMGRYRRLPDIDSTDRGLKSHSERAAINTPIQGGAADVAMMAMIKLVRSETLKRLGWKLLLQVHDEVILEGPEESVEEAQAEVVHCMEEPWDGFGLTPLLVHLAVDADNAKTWYEAK